MCLVKSFSVTVISCSIQGSVLCGGSSRFSVVSFHYIWHCIIDFTSSKFLVSCVRSSENSSILEKDAKKNKEKDAHTVRSTVKIREEDEQSEIPIPQTFSLPTPHMALSWGYREFWNRWGSPCLKAASSRSEMREHFLLTWLLWESCCLCSLWFCSELPSVSYCWYFPHRWLWLHLQHINYL